MAFSTEQELMDVALNSSHLSDFVNDTEILFNLYGIELKGLFGIPDIVVASVVVNDGECFIRRSHAFELKLSNWQRSLVQAYRYRAFANLSYVLIDDDRKNPALKNIERFKRSNIGLLSINQRGVILIHHQPTFDIPYSDQLTIKFEGLVRNRVSKINKPVEEMLIL